MKRWWMVLWLIEYGVIKSEAQFYFYNDRYYAGNFVLEGGCSGGMMNSLTDLGGRKGNGTTFLKDLNWSVSRPSYSVFLTGLFKEIFGLRIEFTSGKITSYDSLLKSPERDLTQRYGRNLGFRSDITEIQLTSEFYPFSFKQFGENKISFWSPYLLAGIGYFWFNPQASLNGAWYDLKPLRLEGQGFAEYSTHKTYQLQQINIPVGFGIKYELSACINTRFEIIHRLLFTDYLDDVSTVYIDPNLFDKYLSPAQAELAKQLYCRIRNLPSGSSIQEGTARGDYKHNDAFFTIQLKISWVFREKIK
jgi:hypothetical protein